MSLTKNSRQNGFSIVEAVIVVGVLALVVFIGWRAYEANQAKEDMNAQTAAPLVTNPNGSQSELPQVAKKEDLQAAAAFLNDASIDKDLDTSEIDAVLSE